MSYRGHRPTAILAIGIQATTIRFRPENFIVRSRHAQKGPPPDLVRQTTTGIGSPAVANSPASGLFPLPLFEQIFMHWLYLFALAFFLGGTFALAV